jgi:hypothetical protein
LRKTPFFRRTLSKIAENCDRNIGPRYVCGKRDQNVPKIAYQGNQPFSPLYDFVNIINDHNICDFKNQCYDKILVKKPFSSKQNLNNRPLGEDSRRFAQSGHTECDKQ